MGTVFYAGYTFRTRLSIIALLPPSLANNIVVADVLSSGLSPCVPNLERHGQALEGLHASLEGRSKPVAVMGCLYLHNGVERHLPIPVVTTTVCSVVVLHCPLIFRYFLLRLGDHCRRLTAAVLWKYLDQPAVPLESPPWTMLCTLRSPLPRPSGHRPRLRLEPARVSLEEIARVSALLCCRPGRCLISNSYSCKASIHLARRPFGSFNPCSHVKL